MRSVILVLLAVFLSGFSFSGVAWAGSININTAGVSELQGLTGIGEVISERIVEYRQAHGDFERPEDLKKVSGIGSVTFDNIKPYITVGEGQDPEEEEADTPPEEEEEEELKEGGEQDKVAWSEEKSQRSLSAHASPVSLSVVEPEPELEVSAGRDRLTAVGVAVTLEGEVVSGLESERDEAEYVWSLGDGRRAEGQRISQAYEHPGQYEVVLNVEVDGRQAVSRLTVQVVENEVELSGVDLEENYIELANLGEEEVNVGEWSVKVDSRPVVSLAQDTIIRGAGTVRVPIGDLGVAPEELGQYSAELFTGNGLLVDEYWPDYDLGEEIQDLDLTRDEVKLAVLVWVIEELAEQNRISVDEEKPVESRETEVDDLEAVGSEARQAPYSEAREVVEPETGESDLGPADDREPEAEEGGERQADSEIMILDSSPEEPEGLQSHLRNALESILGR